MIPRQTFRKSSIRTNSLFPLNYFFCRLEKEKVTAIDCGDEAARWFSRYILEKDSGLRLGYNDASRRRDISKTHKNLLNYYLNLSSASTVYYIDKNAIQNYFILNFLGIIF